MRRHALLPYAIAAAVLLFCGSAQAAPIQYVAADLGGGTWQYDYYLGSNSFLSQDGFTVYFDYQVYSNLQILPPATPDWDLLLEQPSLPLTSDGIYDALALADNPAFTGPFSVSFLWAGAGNPGSQPYDLYTLDASGFPDPFESGSTVPRDVTVAPVPEPASLLLLGTGLAAARTFRRKRNQS